MKRRNVGLWMVLAMLWGVVFVPCGFGGIIFGNVDGADGWVWVEAENMVSQNGMIPFWGSSGTSGWSGANDSIVYSSNPSGGYATYTFTVPVAMANAKLIARAGGNYDDDYRSVKVISGDVSGSVLGRFNTRPGYALRESTNLGILAAGDTTMTLQIEVYCDTRIDGFFLSSGSLTSTGVVSVPPYEWMSVPTFTGDLPVLDRTPFTPTITGAPDGATYWVNGIRQVGGFSQISLPGDYNLVVKSSAGDILSGVSFSYVPEPGTLGLLGISILGLLRRRS